MVNNFPIIIGFVVILTVVTILIVSFGLLVFFTPRTESTKICKKDYNGKHPGKYHEKHYHKKEFHYKDKEDKEGTYCRSDSDCPDGQLCDKYPHAINGICVAIPSTGEKCTPFSNRCASGDTCAISIVEDALGNNLYPQVNYSVEDFAQIELFEYRHSCKKNSYRHHKKLCCYKERHPCKENKEKNINNLFILLLQDGNFIVDRFGQLKLFQSELHMERIVTFGNQLFAVTSPRNNQEAGLLYRLSSSSLNSDTVLTWSWELQEWAPENIIHLSATNDSDYVWIQSFQIENTGNTIGRLYQIPEDNSEEQPELVLEVELKNVIRNYGNNSENYIEFNPTTCQGTLFPLGVPIDNICYGSILPGGNIFSINESQKERLKITRVKQEGGIYITNRLCEADVQ